MKVDAESLPRLVVHLLVEQSDVTNYHALLRCTSANSTFYFASRLRVFTWKYLIDQRRLIDPRLL